MIGKELNYKIELILYKDRKTELFILGRKLKSFIIKIYPHLKKKKSEYSLFPSRNTLFSTVCWILLMGHR